MFELTLTRKSVNRLNEDITRRKLRKLVKSIERRRSLGFSAKISKLQEPEEINEQGLTYYNYSVNLKLQSLLKDEQKIAENFKQIVAAINRNSNIKDWQVLHNNEESQIINSPSMKSREPFNPPVLTDGVYSSYFGDIYEREAHIRVIHDSVRMLVKSNGDRRSHILLYSRPGSAKTTMLERFKLWYDENSEWERMVTIDSPTLTKAGFENWIIQRADEGGLPEIVVLEEIEKQNIDNMLSLLSIMQSGYLMKTNARIGRKKVDVPCLIIATCNDPELLRSFRNGALWSRFSHKLHCSRPSQELIKKIVSKEISKINGNPLWLDGIIRIMENKPCPIDDVGDVREIIGLIDGQDRLLDGSYLQDLIKINKN